MTILGAVLAGGHATRFGRDKALALLGETTLLDHALASLRPHVDALVVIGREHAPVPTAPDLPFPDLGPLGGIAGALAYARDHGHASVLTTACDTPSLPRALVAALLASEAAHAAGAPTVGRWPVRLLESLLAHLQSAESRSIKHWAATQQVIAVLPGVTVANINTPDDLARLASNQIPPAVI
ncbi:molybdenum cofactor guanylyltransferase [Sphingomonas sp. Mn802worker]|uniref:molybdenum cofactor guanylyltransferase n=1 Tax=Sphingomonas sp. Mn802worker TaxID=629773 RepID=UPI00035D1BAF|nr:molybdenum cofactor guanylyltransferase [Sphingomonas sp. Mn802worker]